MANLVSKAGDPFVFLVNRKEKEQGKDSKGEARVCGCGRRSLRSMPRRPVCDTHLWQAGADTVGWDRRVCEPARVFSPAVPTRTRCAWGGS